MIHSKTERIIIRACRCLDVSHDNTAKMANTLIKRYLTDEEIPLFYAYFVKGQRIEDYCKKHNMYKTKAYRIRSTILDVLETLFTPYINNGFIDVLQCYKDTEQYDIKVGKIMQSRGE